MTNERRDEINWLDGVERFLQEEEYRNRTNAVSDPYGRGLQAGRLELVQRILQAIQNRKESIYRQENKR